MLVVFRERRLWRNSDRVLEYIHSLTQRATLPHVRSIDIGRIEQLHRAYFTPIIVLRMPHRFVHPLINTLPTPRRSIKFGAVPLRSKQNYFNIIASIETRTRDIRSDVCPSKYLRSSDMIGYDSTDSMTRSVIDKYFFFFRIFRGRARAGRRRGTRITTRLGAVTPGNRTCLAYAFA